MGISSSFKERLAKFSEEDRDRLIRMGWEDRTTFDVIESQFGLTQNEFIRFKRANQQGHLKHEKMRGVKISRFKAAGQSVEGRVKRYK